MKLIFILIVIIIVFLFINTYGSLQCVQNQNELFDNDSSEAIKKKNNDLADIIFNFINDDTSYTDYLKFILTTSSTYNNLVSADAFYVFKALKRNNMLDKNIIISKMNN